MLLVVDKSVMSIDMQKESALGLQVEMGVGLGLNCEDDLDLIREVFRQPEAETVLFASVLIHKPIHSLQYQYDLVIFS